MNHPLLTTVLAPRLNLLGTSLVTAALAFLLFLPAPTALAFDVELDGNNATAITNLEVDGVLYDVDFLHDRWGRIWPNGTPFDFTTYSTAQAAVEAVTAALNTVPEVVTVGPDKEDRFRIPFDILVLDVALTWEGIYDPPWNTFDGDGNGSPWADFETVTYAKFTLVGTGSQPPVADANGPYGGDVGASISFDGSASSDTDGTIESWEWDFGDNNTGSGETTTHTYATAGVYTVTLTVTDNDGLSDDSTETFADIGPVDLTGNVEDAGGTPLCALVLASGQFMFSCNPNGPFSLADLPREADGTVKRQVYVDGFFPDVETLTASADDTVVMTRAGSCPDYNAFPEPGVYPNSEGKRINVSGKIVLQNSQEPVCAMALGNGQFGFTCDGTGRYSATIPLDANGQYKLQVYADGFAPMVQRFDEFTPDVEVRLARDVECSN